MCILLTFKHTSTYLSNSFEIWDYLPLKEVLFLFSVSPFLISTSSLFSLSLPRSYLSLLSLPLFLPLLGLSPIFPSLLPFLSSSSLCPYFSPSTFLLSHSLNLIFPLENRIFFSPPCSPSLDTSSILFLLEKPVLNLSSSERNQVNLK